MTDQHVRGLDVAVHEASFVRVMQCQRQRLDEREQPITVRGRARRPTREVRLQVFAGQQWHDEERHTFNLARIADRANERVRELAQGLNFSIETQARASHRQQAWLQQLQRALAAIGAARSVDDAHGAGAEPLEQQVRAERQRRCSRGPRRRVATEADAIERRQQPFDFGAHGRILCGQQLRDSRQVTGGTRLQALADEVVDEVVLVVHGTGGERWLRSSTGRCCSASPVQGQDRSRW